MDSDQELFRDGRADAALRIPAKSGCNEAEAGTKQSSDENRRLHAKLGRSSRE